MRHQHRLTGRTYHGRDIKQKDRLKKNDKGELILKWWCQRDIPMQSNPSEFKKSVIIIRLNKEGTMVTWEAVNGSPRPNWRCVVEALRYFIEKLDADDVNCDAATDVQVHQDKKAVSAMHEGKRYSLERRKDHLVGVEPREGKSPAVLKRVPLPVLRAVLEQLEHALDT